MKAVGGATPAARTCTELVVAVKAFHSLAFLVIQSAILYFVYKGARRESDRQAGLAAAIAIGETVIYVSNGFHCPLTKLAEDLGAEHGAITDIFLPKWLATNIAHIYTPLLLLGVMLHIRNLVALRADRVSEERPSTTAKRSPMNWPCSAK